MQRKINITIILIISVLIICSCSKPEDRENDKLNITVSALPYKYLVEKIGGESVDVFSAIPKGADPHHFEPDPRTIKQIENSDCYFLVGGSFDFERVLFAKMISIDDSLKSVDLSENVSFIGDDPHIWLSLRNLKIISKNVLSGLENLLPAESEHFRENYKSLVDSLDYVDSLLTETINKTQMKYLVVNHSAWNYFSRDYGLEEIAVQYGSKTTSAKELAEYVDFIKKNDIKLILSDPEHSQNAINAITEQTEVNIEIIDPLPDDVINEFIKINNIIKKQYESN